MNADGMPCIGLFERGFGQTACFKSGEMDPQIGSVFQTFILIRPPGFQNDNIPGQERKFFHHQSALNQVQIIIILPYGAVGKNSMRRYGTGTVYLQRRLVVFTVGFPLQPGTEICLC